MRHLLGLQLFHVIMFKELKSYFKNNFLVTLGTEGMSGHVNWFY